jgi:tetratricopeptide (TPR) repeat protein
VRLAFALRPYCINCGLLGLGLRIATEALARTSSTARNSLRCNALFDVGQLCFYVGQYGPAQRYIEECIAIARELADQELEADALQVLGMVFLSFNERESAQASLDLALDLSLTLGYPRRTAGVASALAQFHRAAGSHGLAIKYNLETLAIGREYADQQVIGVCLLNLAMLYIDDGDSSVSRNYIKETLELESARNSLAIAQCLLEVTCALACLCSDWDAALAMYSGANSIAVSSGLQRDPADEIFLRPRLEILRATLGDREFTRAISAANPDEWSCERALQRVENWIASPAQMKMDESYPIAHHE